VCFFFLFTASKNTALYTTVSFCNGSRSNKLKEQKTEIREKEVEEKETITMFSMLQFHSYFKIKASDTIYRQNRKKGTAA
jgi:hypothetical protein